MGYPCHALDRGGEYVNDDFTAHLQLKGTIWKLSIHDTHQHSGVAERHNQTIQEQVRALLHASGLPKNLWTEAARHAVWMLNRTSTKAVEGMMPYEAAFAKKSLTLQEYGNGVKRCMFVLKGEISWEEGFGWEGGWELMMKRKG
jgi:hypothetical protein